MNSHGPEENNPTDDPRKIVESIDAVLPGLALLAEMQNSASTSTVLALVLFLRVLTALL